MSSIKNPDLYKTGLDKINWVESYMPALNKIKAEFEKTKPFKGMKIAASIHMEAKTAFLAICLKAGGAEVHITGCNPLSTQDDVAAALYHLGFEVNGWRGVNDEEYKTHLVNTLSCCPDLIIDDGGDLINLLHGEYKEYGKNLLGGCEETTTGIHRLQAKEKAGILKYTMIDVNDADCKHLFDNRYGTGQSSLDGIMNSTNLIIAGKTVVIAGYGWCGKGISMRVKGMGGIPIITEINPVRAIEAVMDGFTVMPMAKAAEIGDLFITVTGCCDVIRKEHFEVMKDGVLVCNSGHFDCEIDKKALAEMSTEIFERKPNIVGYRQKDGRIINLMAEGRLVNLAAGNGHPVEIMDMSFALQAKCLEYLAKNGKNLENKLYEVPKEIDEEVANIKLSALNVTLDKLSDEQIEYMNKTE